MIKINTFALLGILELMLVFIVLLVIAYFQYTKKCRAVLEVQGEVKKLTSDLDDSQLEIKNLRFEIKELKKDSEDQEKAIAEQSVYKELFEELQKKFAQMKDANAKLKDAVKALIPDANKSGEYEKLIAMLEQNNKELDMCINTLEMENRELDGKVGTIENKIIGMSNKLDHAVDKVEFDRIVAEKNRFELRLKHLDKSLDEKTEEYEQLEKDYMWLEKEYNALYANITGA